MKRVALLLLLIAAGSATADPFADTPSDRIGMDESSAGASTMYEVDEDRDGRTDRLLILGSAADSRAVRLSRVTTGKASRPFLGRGDSPHGMQAHNLRRFPHHLRKETA
jgi:hypothetical protein